MNRASTKRLSSQWREMPLGDVVELKRGYDLPKKKRIAGSVPLVSSSGISDYHAEAKVRGPGVVTGRYGTLGQVYFLRDDFWPLNTTLYVRDFKGNDPRFIAYFLESLDFSAYSDKAAVPGLNRNHLHQALVRLPPLPEQRAIAHVLGTLDDKIPEGWAVKPLGDVIEMHDKKRVPLNSRERAKRRGQFRYYGAVGVVDYVDDFLFDGVYVLVGEDGSVIDSDGRPVVQYVWGQFWVNNHAHVLRGRSGFSNEHLSLLLGELSIMPYVTGAVQPKLSQKNLKSIPIVLPGEAATMAFANQIEPVFDSVRDNSDEIEPLAALRDEVLPRLVSGEVGVA